MTKRQWTRDELILAFDLYCRIPFGRIHIRNPEITALSDLLGRTPSAVSWKLANLARFDPALQSRNIKGAAHGSRADQTIWDEFHERGEDLVYEAQEILVKKGGLAFETMDAFDDEIRLGLDREARVKTRVGQSFFRSAVLTSYNWTCCVTGLQGQALLNASHIVPWAVDRRNRVNPSNGLCLNALHDRAFDRGLMTISEDYRVIFAEELKKNEHESLNALVLRYEGGKLAMPERFRPDQTLLKYHRERVFLG